MAHMQALPMAAPPSLARQTQQTQRSSNFQGQALLSGHWGNAWQDSPEFCPPVAPGVLIINPHLCFASVGPACEYRSAGGKGPSS